MGLESLWKETEAAGDFCGSAWSGPRPRRRESIRAFHCVKGHCGAWLEGARLAVATLTPSCRP